jgi:translation elongation factor EF-G
VQVRPCLVINKIDRLFNELHLTAEEAYHHIRKVLEQVNAVAGVLFNDRTPFSSSSHTHTHTPQIPLVLFLIYLF